MGVQRSCQVLRHAHYPLCCLTSLETLIAFACIHACTLSSRLCQQGQALVRLAYCSLSAHAVLTQCSLSAHSVLTQCRICFCIPLNTHCTRTLHLCSCANSLHLTCCGQCHHKPGTQSLAGLVWHSYTSLLSFFIVPSRNAVTRQQVSIDVPFCTYILLLNALLGCLLGYLHHLPA